MLLALLMGCGEDGPDDTPPPDATRFRFDEVAAAAGLDLSLTCGEPGAKETILEVNGNGLALLDLEGDGDLDVLLVDGSTRARVVDGAPVDLHLLRNDGTRDGVPRFTPLADHGLVMHGWPSGACAGDVDGDGLPDLVVGGWGEDALFLQRPDADGAPRFEKRPLPGRAAPTDWTTSVALADVTGDGHLDLYLVRYLLIDAADPPIGRLPNGPPCRYRDVPVMCGPHGLPPQPDVLLTGTGEAPWFEDVTATSGVGDVPAAYGLGVLLVDLDADGDLDVYVSNDSVDNHLLRNHGDGTFEDVGVLSGAATDMAGVAQAGMGVAAGDVDGDGDPDLMVTNFSDETHTLYRNDGRMLFRDVTAVAGLARSTRPLLGWGVALEDLDADGHLDLFIANGHVYAQADDPRIGSAWAQPHLLHPGRGDGRFDDDAWPDPTPWPSRGATAADLDGDGDRDLLVLTMDGPPRLYLNRTDAPERQLLVSLETPAGAPAIGAVLELRTDDGVTTRPLLSATSFQCGASPRVHVAGRGPVREVAVRWPGSSGTGPEGPTVEPLPADAMMFGQHVRVRQGEGVVARTPLRRD